MISVDINSDDAVTSSDDVLSDRDVSFAYFRKLCEEILEKSVITIRKS
jgi:hypothetical protein